MSKFQLKNFFKAAYNLMLVFLQFFIIILHFLKWEFLPKSLIAINNIMKAIIIIKNPIKHDKVLT